MILPDTNLGRLILEHSSIIKTADKKNDKLPDIDEAKKVSSGLAKIASIQYSEKSYESVQEIMKIASDCIKDLIDIGLDFPSYPQLIDMGKQFLDELVQQNTSLVYENGRYKLNNTVILRNDSTPGLEPFFWTLRYLKEKKLDKKVSLKAPITGPFTLASYVEIKKGSFPFNTAISDLDKVLNTGLNWTLDNGYAIKEDLIHCEENGFLKDANASLVSQKAKQRAIKQLGSLGSGNHFLEIQKVDKIFDKMRKNTKAITFEKLSKTFGPQKFEIFHLRFWTQPAFDFKSS